MTLLLLSFFSLGAASVTHPVFPPAYNRENVPSLQKNVADAMAMTPKELYAFVPAASGIFFCGCPHCDGGSQEHALQWSLDLGDHVKCKYCDMVFPNEQYAPNREKVIIAPSGARQVYRWYENAEGRQYFFEARAWYARWQWTRDRAYRLASLYALTGGDAYGDRAAAIVGRYAQVFPDYAIRFDFPFRPVRFWPADQKWPYDSDIAPFRGAKFYWWGYGDIPERLARAYDLLAAGDSFDRMAALLGDDIEARIESDLIRMGYDFVAANRDDLGNMSPGMYHDMVVAGRVIGAPEMVHEAVDRFRALLNTQFYADGWWREAAPSYHLQTVGALLRVVDVAQGYSDPPEWGEERFENLDLKAEVPMLAKAMKVSDEAVLPNGRSIPINDTWWTTKRATLSSSESRLWPAMGHALLGAGNGETQCQLHCNWSGAHGHAHADNASLILFAFGKELLSDIGYTHTRYRNWTINSASHNVVVVDQRSQELRGSPDPSVGNLLFYDDAHPHVRVLCVDARSAYSSCTAYGRALVHIHIGEGKDYVVDLFRVKGGAAHDYFLHGCADEQGAFESTVAFDESLDSLVPEWGGTTEHTGEDCYDMSGETHHAYMFLWDIRTVPADGSWSATWRYDGAGLRSHLFPESNTTLYRFVAPSVRQARDNDGKLKDFLMHGVMQRHAGGESSFAAVHEPFQSEPWISSVTFDDGVFTVTRDNAVDTIAWEGDPTTLGKPFRLRVQSSEGWNYDSGQPLTREVKEVQRGDAPALVVDQPMASADVRHVLLSFEGRRTYACTVKTIEGDRLLLTEDPGFEYDSDAQQVRFLSFPHETFSGPPRFITYVK